MVPDIFDPPRGNFRDMDEAFLFVVLIKLNEGSKVDDVNHSADNQISYLWPGFSHKTSSICVLISALPPRGSARVRPQTIQFTVDEALPNTI
jgi:hypothetical protein